jgi:multidrug efflux system outer membrane protein
VLNAFQQVEDNLSLLTNLSHEAHDEDDAADCCQGRRNRSPPTAIAKASSIIWTWSRRRPATCKPRNAEQVRTRRLQASVNLIRALGGGWTATQMKNSPPPMAATR